MRADGMVARPPATVLADPRSGRERTRIAAVLAETLSRVVRQAAPAPPSAPVPAPTPAPAPSPREAAPVPEGTDSLRIAPLPTDAIAQLRETSARIREGAGRGEVLAQVLRLRGPDASRALRCSGCAAIAPSASRRAASRAPAGRTTTGCGELSLGSREPAWFRRVIEERRPLRGRAHRQRRPSPRGAARQRDPRRGVRRADRDGGARRRAALRGQSARGRSRSATRALSRCCSTPRASRSIGR